MHEPDRFVLSPSPLLVTDKGSSMRHRVDERNGVRVPRDNDMEYKCTGSASDGSAHVEVVICIAEEGGQ